jgi:predicted lipase
MLKISPVFGFVATRPGAVLVSIRGTETPGEWLCDFEAAPASCKITSGTVHEGFQRVYEVIRDSALQGLSDAFKTGDTLYVTGHSLGAALALLFADDAVSATQNLQVGTFAGPRTGLPDFAASFNQRVPNTVRVVNRWDIVPNVPVPAPPLCLYEHVGSSLNIDGGFTFDLGHAHSLPLSYLPGLKKVVGAPNKMVATP